MSDRFDFPTIAAALDSAAGRAGELSFFSSRGAREQTLTYAALAGRARLIGLKLACRLPRGSVVAIIAETDPDFLACFYGCQYAGLVAAPLAGTVFPGGREAYLGKLAGLIAASTASLVLCPASLIAPVQAAAARAGAQAMTTADLLMGDDGRIQPLQDNEPAYIQFSSGSTAEPRGILVAQRTVRANVGAILSEGLAVRPDDRAFSWLPLYHDMGLVGFSIAPLYAGTSVDYLAPSTFARRPALWLKLMSERGSTITYSPSFGYQIAADRIGSEAGSLALYRLRVAGIGGDMVRPEVLDYFARRLAPSGFDPRAFRPSYGLAETVLAASFARMGVKTARLGGSERQFVGCGPVIAGHELVVAGPDGAPLPEGEVGALRLRGPSTRNRYWQGGVTRDMLSSDGWLDTGDLGFAAHGEIFVTGRSKDVIIVNGRNIWPQDLEWVAEGIPPLSSGDTAAFGTEDESGEQVVLLVQARLDPAAASDLVQTIKSAIGRAVGVGVVVKVVPPKSLPFTSSGKLSRSAAKAAYLATAGS